MVSQQQTLGHATYNDTALLDQTLGFKPVRIAVCPVGVNEAQIKRLVFLEAGQSLSGRSNMDIDFVRLASVFNVGSSNLKLESAVGSCHAPHRAYLGMLVEEFQCHDLAVLWQRLRKYNS